GTRRSVSDTNILFFFNPRNALQTKAKPPTERSAARPNPHTRALEWNQEIRRTGQSPPHTGIKRRTGHTCPAPHHLTPLFSVNQIQKTGQTCPARLRPVALLILLPAAAGTRIVPPGLLPRHHRRRPARPVAAHELQLLHLALLLALDVAREVLHSGLGRQPLLLVGVGSRRSFHLARFFLVLLGERQHRTRVRAHLQEVQIAHRLVFDAVHHGGE